MHFFLSRQDLERFLREARAAAGHLDTAESEISFQASHTGPDSPVSPIDALQRHRQFREHSLSVPEQVIKQGEIIQSHIPTYLYLLFVLWQYIYAY